MVINRLKTHYQSFIALSNPEWVFLNQIRTRSRIYYGFPGLMVIGCQRKRSGNGPRVGASKASAIFTTSTRWRGGMGTKLTRSDAILWPTRRRMSWAFMICPVMSWNFAGI